MENVKQWYYRGSLKSCNYSCSYCPFSKHEKESQMAIEKDRKNLIRFADYIIDMYKDSTKGSCAIQIVPYGEALIHKYYWQEIAKLSKETCIDAVGAQSNLSFNVDNMISEYLKNGGRIAKLRLWCTFHFQMTDVYSFVSQCKKLTKYKVNFCVGVVGNPEYINEIINLRKELDTVNPNIYLWINKMDGLKRKYTAYEIEEFLKIDEYFENELKFHKADILQCSSSCFVESDGQMQRCNISRQSIGNLYKHDMRSNDIKNAYKEKNNLKESHVVECLRKRCSCYLAYCNINEADLIFFKPYPAFRIPIYPKAVFFDIDGTLVAKGERIISDEIVEKLKRLSAHSRLFAATSLPYEYASAKLNNAMDIFSGGVFAGGGVCIVKNDDIYREHVKNFVINGEAVRNIDLKYIKEQSEKYGYIVRLYKTKLYNSLSSKAKSAEYKENESLYIKITLSFKKSRINCDNRKKDKFDNTYNMLENMKRAAVELGIISCDIDSAEYKENNTFILNGIKVTFEENCMQITSDKAGKKEGIIYICEKEGYKREDIAVFGNSENDILMLKYFPFSVAVNPVSSNVRQAAAYCFMGI